LKRRRKLSDREDNTVNSELSESNPATPNQLFSEESSDGEIDYYQDIEEGNLKWKELMLEKVKKNFLRPVNLMKLVYGDNSNTNNSENANKNNSESNDSESEEFFTALKSNKSYDLANEVESSIFKRTEGDLLDLTNEEVQELLKSRFVSRDFVYDSKYNVNATVEPFTSNFEDLEKTDQNPEEEEKVAEENIKNEVEQEKLISDKKKSY